MDKSLLNQISKLEEEVKSALLTLKIDDLTKKLDDLKVESQKSDFWSDGTKAQAVMKEISKLEKAVEPWQKLNQSISDLKEMSDLEDKSLAEELRGHLESASSQFNSLKKQLKFKGQYDDHDAYIYIYAGAGGTDAQDWAEMLYRMYNRWAEKNGYGVHVVDQSPGEEAGLKSIALEIDGSYIYGKLKGEHGVHRLVRLSPFNADNLRQTSFAKVDILPKIDHPDEVKVEDKDLKVDVFRSGGHGGQSVNTTDSAVRVTHLPSGISVVIQNERSQLQNKELALNVMRSRLAQLQMEQHAKQISQIKGPNKSAEWGSQIRSYVLHPYKQVKDLRTDFKSNDPDKILDGQLDELIDSYLEKSLDISPTV